MPISFPHLLPHCTKPAGQNSSPPTEGYQAHSSSKSCLSWPANVFSCVKSQNRDLRKQLALKDTRRGPGEDPCSLSQMEVTALDSMLVYPCLRWECACVCVWSFCLCPDGSVGFVDNKWFWLWGYRVHNLWCVFVQVERTHIGVWLHMLPWPFPAAALFVRKGEQLLECFSCLFCVLFPFLLNLLPTDQSLSSGPSQSLCKFSYLDQTTKIHFCLTPVMGPTCFRF